MNRWLTLLIVVLLEGCSDGGGPEPLRVFAASSLTDAFTQAAEAFEEAGGPQVAVTFAGSQTLLVQLSEGAEADVLATADESTMDQARQAELVEEPVIFASNSLLVITPTTNPGNVGVVEDLARPGVKLVLAAQEVPAGRYAREALVAAGGDGVLDNLVSEEEDVKGVVGKVVSGEADAGVVYVTDVTPEIEDRVRSLPLPASDVDIRYPIAATTSAAPTASEFIEFIVEGDGAAVLREAGFTPP